MNPAQRVPRVVLVTRRTDYEMLLYRHGTREQARFFLETRGQTIETAEGRHRRFEAALQEVLSAIPVKWRRSRVDRTDLDRFVFEPEDLVVALGQDGLVANVAKYLSEQLVLGVNPDPDSYDGVLVRHAPSATARLLAAAVSGQVDVEQRALVEADVDDGQRLLALNEIFVGHRTHQSARYRISFGTECERQSSSGVIVTTGTGSTGWARSIRRRRKTSVVLPEPGDSRLAFFVREAFPSRATGTALVDGSICESETLEIVSEMNENGVIFGDGIEEDRIDFGWGMRATLRVAAPRLHLVRE
jgi:NAD kinase